MSHRIASTTFTNPILRGFQPDPSICRVGRDFYVVTSSFEYFPGVPLFHSRDLVHFRQLGHVLTRKSQLDLTRTESSHGIYAPTLRHHDGLFYLVTTHVGGRGNFYVTARRPEGPWSEPRWLDTEGFDPSLLFAEGKAFYLRDGHPGDVDHPEVFATTLDLRAKKLRGKLRPIWRGTGGVWPEGAHVYARNGEYFLFAAEGGTSYEHSEVVARGPTPFGPFTPGPRNPILTHRDRPRHPFQALGHADLVELEDGSSYCVCLGIRTSGGRHHHLGRETFLAPVTWDDEGWPVIGRRGHIERVMPAPALPRHPLPRPPARDDFERAELAPHWTFLRNPERATWSLAKRPGYLRLVGSSAGLDDVGAPAFVGRRQSEFDATFKTRLEFEPLADNEEAGLVVRGNEAFYYALCVRRAAGGRTVSLVRRSRGKTRVAGEAAVAAGAVELEIVATRHAYTFFASVRGRRQKLGVLPSRGLSTETIWPHAGRHFTGVVIAMYATGNGRRSRAPADFDWFEYRTARAEG